MNFVTVAIEREARTGARRKNSKYSREREKKMRVNLDADVIDYDRLPASRQGNVMVNTFVNGTSTIVHTIRRVWVLVGVLILGKEESSDAE